MFARHFTLTLLLACLAASLPARAGRLLEMEIVNRSNGGTLNPYRQGGQAYVAGDPGDRYAVRLVNRSGRRLLVVLSVDGVNAVSGETASPDQSGYVLAPWASIEIAGWRKNMDEIAQFYFTALSDSYAARTDRPDNVGVVGAAVFQEKEPSPQPAMSWLGPAEPAARSAPRPYDQVRREVREVREAREARKAREMHAVPEANKSNDGANDGTAATGAMSARSFVQAPRKEERLGTGHGAREYAPTRYTRFERASAAPDEVLSLRYDSRENLIARGILPMPQPERPAPRPFPGRFVPDPEG